MPKRGREKQTAANAVRPAHTVITHEPEDPINWPDGHVDVQLTPKKDDECILITIHGVKHYLHSTTAYELYKKLETKITEWDKQAKADGVPGVID